MDITKLFAGAALALLLFVVPLLVVMSVMDAPVGWMIVAAVFVQTTAVVLMLRYFRNT